MNEQKNILEEQLTVFGNRFGHVNEEDVGIQDNSKVLSQGTWKNDSIIQTNGNLEQAKLYELILIYNSNKGDKGELIFLCIVNDDYITMNRRNPALNLPLLFIFLS